MAAVFFDGTGCTKTHATNIARMADATPDSLYFPGVGTGSLALIKLTGGAFGAGADKRRDEAYKALCEAWNGGPIHIFGFSRGAAIARMLAVKITNEGVNGHYPEIDFLGCFDTVASFGIPFNIGPLKFQEWNPFHDFHVAGGVRTARHALSLDETRDTFKPSLMNARKGIVERWFIGSHSDIGGGFEERGLANAAMDWMVQEARKSGLHIEDPERGNDTVKVHYTGPGYDSPTASPRLIGKLESDQLQPATGFHGSVKISRAYWPRAIQA